jgi:hypothetical protein
VEQHTGLDLEGVGGLVLGHLPGRGQEPNDLGATGGVLNEPLIDVVDGGKPGDLEGVVRIEGANVGGVGHPQEVLLGGERRRDGQQRQGKVGSRSAIHGELLVDPPGPFGSMLAEDRGSGKNPRPARTGATNSLR